jgi:hypothetical protein
MSETDEIFEIPESELSVVEPQTPTEKTVKKKREISEERRKVILDQLKRGRETARKNRQKKALANRIQKRNKQAKIDQVIKEEIVYGSDDGKLTTLEAEIKELKELLKQQTKVSPRLEIKIEKREKEVEEIKAPPPPQTKK